nr:reverse transcriptase domain-containing protein [Tanacetum cinerariifolium]
MITRSAGPPVAASRGGGTGGRASSGGRTKVILRLRNGRNQNGDGVNDQIRGDVSRGCTYKEFLDCNHKKYDGKGRAIVYTHWIEKIESVQDMSGCRDSQKQKTIQKAVHIAGTLTDEALRNGSIKKNHEKRGNGGEPSKDRNVRDENKGLRLEILLPQSPTL